MAALGHLESKLAILRQLVQADSTIEIAINGDGRVWVERAGDSQMSLADVTLSPVEVKDLAGLIANKQHLTLTDALPAISTTVDYAGATLRCQAIIPPASAGGTTISFRVFRRRPAGEAPRHFRFLRDQRVSLEAERLDKLRAIRRMATEGGDPDDFLRACVKARMNIVISGGTSSGKTELARRLLWMVEEWHRLVLIEDSAELLPAQENAVSLIAERAEASARSADKLLEMTLRLRPDRIILGELRGVEAVTFLEAINTGHEGSFTTVHATTARKAVNRLAFLVMRAGMPLTLAEIRDYVRESIDVIVQTGRIGDERGILETYFPALEGEGG
ncbi:ATPase, T2SS/T4P/T4SS family [Paracoccus sp. MC1862]|uniref:ATPase, T2SS/T4P/T4SS family n=1 Tax=Paracoccus sp. MC1862 TaxID=2760307 RepID=UPI001603B47F|nr:ATPase, T2SS/T4P/T4SS family [Paracoccus sp. MC1862]MBB1499116.1 Flp pilus assembly complex ATPase component TadA [Paracoccus sp. MC1862]QQO46574.1 Flp pilus assembly complex ATPase component TadA [Paracoccus sp. MC1862]